jgi:hypothetical protein
VLYSFTPAATKPRANGSKPDLSLTLIKALWIEMSMTPALRSLAAA